MELTTRDRELLTVAEDMGTYTIIWTTLDIMFVVSRVDVDKRSVSGEVQVINMMVENYRNGYLIKRYLNFLASNSVKAFVNDCKEKLDVLPWAEMVDHVGDIIACRARRGEEAQELFTSEDIVVEPPKWCLYPLIIEGHPNIFYGDSGTYKTALSLLFCSLMLLYESPEIYQLGFKPPERSLKTLIFDWEQQSQNALYRMQKLRVGMDLPPFSLHHRHCVLPLHMDLEQAKEWVKEIKPDVIVIDSLMPAAGGDCKDDKVAALFFSSLGMLERTSIILAHQAKNLQGDNTSIYGSAFFKHLARSVWEVKSHQTEGEDNADILLVHKKHNFSRRFAPMSFHVEENDTMTKITRQDVDKVPEFDRSQPHGLRILHYLKDANGAVDREELGEELDIPDGSLRVEISRLVKENKIVKVGKDKIGLRSNELL